MAKLHLFKTLFQGSGPPPLPWGASTAGTGATPPFQQGGSLRFPGVELGGSEGDIDASGSWDLTDDAGFLQFESLLGNASTIEWDLTFPSGWSVTMQLRGLYWNLYVLHGGAIPFEHENILAGDIDPLCWQISYLHDHTLQFMAGPTPWSMRVLDTTGVGVLPPATAATLFDIMIRSVNESAFTITNGETRLVAVNDWFPPGRTSVYGLGGVPNTYNVGTETTGLSAYGTIAAPNNFGARVELTSVPAGWGRSYENPRHYVPAVGSIQFSDLNGDSDLYYVHEDTQLVFAPNLTNLFIRYNFKPGVVANVTPLT